MYHDVIQVKPPAQTPSEGGALPALLAAARRAAEAAAPAAAAHAAHHHHHHEHHGGIALVAGAREVADRARDLLEHGGDLIVGAGAATAGDVGKGGAVDGFHGVGGHGCPRGCSAWRLVSGESRIQQPTCHARTRGRSARCVDICGYRFPETSPAGYAWAWTRPPVSG